MADYYTHFPACSTWAPRRLPRARSISTCAFWTRIRTGMIPNGLVSTFRTSMSREFSALDPQRGLGRCRGGRRLRPALRGGVRSDRTLGLHLQP